VTFVSGTAGGAGVISSSNSLVGSTTGSYVYGGGEYRNWRAVVLSAADNYNYVLVSTYWSSTRGAVTLGSGTAASSAPFRRRTASSHGRLFRGQWIAVRGRRPLGSGGIKLLPNNEWSS